MNHFFTQISKKWKLEWPALGLCLLSVFATMFAIHAYYFFGFSMGHDSGYLHNSFTGITTGRFVGEFFHSLVLGKLQMPFLIGLYEVLHITLIAYLVIRMLGIRSKYTMVLMAIVLAASPALISLNNLMHNAYAYSLGMLFATFGAYLAVSKKWYANLSAIVFIALGTACYQSNLTLAVSLLALCILKHIHEEDSSSRSIFLHIVKTVCIAVLSLLVYLALWDFVLQANASAKSSYLGMNNQSIPSIKQLLYYIYEEYFDTLRELFRPGFCSYTPRYINIIHGTALIYAIWTSTAGLFRQKDRIPKLLAFFLVLIFMPLLINLTRVLSRNMANQLLIKFSFVVFPLMILFLVDRYANHHYTSSNLISFTLVCLLFLNSLYGGNVTATKRRYEYETGISIATQTLARLQSYPGYTPDKRVMFIGIPEIKYPGTGFDWCKDVTGANYSSSMNYHLPIKAVLDRLSPFQKFEAIDLKYLRHEKVLELDLFPAQNCITEIDDIYIIRYSNW